MRKSFALFHWPHFRMHHRNVVPPYELLAVAVAIPATCPGKRSDDGINWAGRGGPALPLLRGSYDLADRFL